MSWAVWTSTIHSPEVGPRTPVRSRRGVLGKDQGSLGSGLGHGTSAGRAGRNALSRPHRIDVRADGIRAYCWSLSTMGFASPVELRLNAGNVFVCSCL